MQDTRASAKSLRPQFMSLPKSAESQIVRHVNRIVRSMKFVLPVVGASFLFAAAAPQADVQGTPAVNPWGSKDLKITTLSCPAGSYLRGINVHWGGTCQGQCDQDGGAIHELEPICTQLPAPPHR
jgi:hypothetical protein